MAKLIQFNPEQRRNRTLKKAGRKKLAQEDLGQLNLFEAPKSAMKRIRAFPNPFVEAFYLDEKDNPKAEILYSEAIQKGIFPADAYCNLAIIHAKRDESLKAVELLSKAISINPGHAEAHYNLANMYFDLGDIKLAILHYEIARDADPDFPEIYFNLGLAYLIDKQRDKATRVLKIYTDLYPEKTQEAKEILSKL